MGRRDFRRRESKKPKKTAKKAQMIPEMLPQVEVIKKVKKEREEE